MPKVARMAGIDPVMGGDRAQFSIHAVVRRAYLTNSDYPAFDRSEVTDRPVLDPIVFAVRQLINP